MGTPAASCFEKSRRVQFLQLALVRALRRCGGVLGEIVDDGEGRNREDLLIVHQAHGFVRELEGVIDRNHARTRGVQRAGLAGGVDSNVLAHARGFLDRGHELSFGVLIRRGEFAITDHVPAGLIDLDKIGAQLELLADSGDQFIGVVGTGGVR